MTAALIIGSTVCDVMIYLDRLPSREGDAHIDHQQWSVGGCAFNVVNIIKFRLGDYGFHLEEDLIKLLSNHNCLTNSYDSCYFAQKIIEYNLIESNLSNGKQTVSLPSELF